MSKNKQKKMETDDLYSGDIPTTEEVDEKPESEAGPVEDVFKMPVGQKFAFVGVGAAGGRIVDEFFKKGYRKCIALNTTKVDQTGLSEDLECINFDTGGSGKDPSVCRELLSRSQVKLQLMGFFKSIIGDKPDYILVCVGLGGGTGSGGGPVVVEMLREYVANNGLNAKVGCILSLPRAGEGPRIQQNALDSFERFLSLQVSPIILLDNEKVAQSKNSSLLGIHDDANKEVAMILHSINTLTATSGIQTFDAADFGQLLNSGIVVFGFSGKKDWDKGSDEVSNAVLGTFNTSTQAEMDTTTATQGACLVMAGTEVLRELKHDVLMNALDLLKGSSQHKNMMLHPGIYENRYEGQEQSLRVFVALGGLQPHEKTIKRIASKGNVEIPSKLAAFFGFR